MSVRWDTSSFDVAGRRTSSRTVRRAETPPRPRTPSHPAIPSPRAPRTVGIMPTLEQARAALKQYFGYPDFRGAQADAVQAVLAGRDVLVLMPTGGGKSL